MNKNKTSTNERIQVEAKLLLLDDTKFTESFREIVINPLNVSPSTDVILSDSLSIKFGEHLHRKLKKPHQANYIRQRMLQCAQVLRIARVLDGSISDFESLLNPIKFPTLIQTVDRLCKYDESTGFFGVSDLPLKLGDNLRNVPKSY